MYFLILYCLKGPFAEVISDKHQLEKVIFNCEKELGREAGCELEPLLYERSPTAASLL